MHGAIRFLPGSPTASPPILGEPYVGHGVGALVKTGSLCKPYRFRSPTVRSPQVTQLSACFHPHLAPFSWHRGGEALPGERTDSEQGPRAENPTGGCPGPPSSAVRDSVQQNFSTMTSFPNRPSNVGPSREVCQARQASLRLLVPVWVGEPRCCITGFYF